ncbi:hypothetical protein [Diaphorobacter aerolatus]|uniref:Uncharacterized protein n=1 Tax=Diaphorobacter aerolatus TaxID=1288495 RepID=A0A7H0GKU6_9BURK|nr:hypothetical protein [Diaphorobacter aerolatus]QNP48912.1 hypothetical protein H9K75_01540 [Diaphorobacter aerolatus]
MIPITSEKVHGVLDDATYTATLCMARDGKHFFFTAVAVDGNVVDVPNKRWNSRRAAMHALAEIASANRRPEGSPPASPFLGLTEDLLLLADDALTIDPAPLEDAPQPPEAELPGSAAKGKPKSKAKPKARPLTET